MCSSLASSPARSASPARPRNRLGPQKPGFRAHYARRRRVQKFCGASTREITIMTVPLSVGISEVLSFLICCSEKRGPANKTVCSRDRPVPSHRPLQKLFLFIGRSQDKRAATLPRIAPEGQVSVSSPVPDERSPGRVFVVEIPVPAVQCSTPTVIIFGQPTPEPNGLLCDNSVCVRGQPLDSKPY